MTLRKPLKHQNALRVTPEGHAELPSRMSNLGNSFMRRFEHFRDLTDIDQALVLHQNAIQLTPDGHANLPSLLNNLANSL